MALDVTVAGPWSGGDVTTALQTAISDVDDGGRITLPPGVGIATAKLAPATKSIHFVGAGMRQTTIRWTNADGGIDFFDDSPGGTSNKLMKTLQISDMTLETTQAAGGTALRVRSTLDTRSVPALIMHNVMTRPSQAHTSAYWSKSLYATNARFSHVDGCFFRGVDNTTGTTHHVHIDGQSTNFQFTNVHSMQCNYSLLVEGASEGVYVQNWDAVDCEYGFTLSSDGEPMLYIVNSHAQAGRHCVWVTNGRGATVHNCHLILHSDYSTISAGTRSLIRVDGTSTIDTTIVNNRLIMNDAAAASSTLGIDVQAGTGIQITGNTIRNVNSAAAMTGISIASGVADGFVSNNRIPGFAKRVANSGSGIVVGQNL